LLCVRALFATHARGTTLAGVKNYYSIPISRIPASSTSSLDSSEAAEPVPNSRAVLHSFTALLALPLLVPVDDALYVPRVTMAIALCGPFLAGAITGACLSSLQALVPLDQTVLRILLFVLGNLTGSWPASKYSMSTMAFAGCLGSLLLHGTGLTLVGCWFLGVGAGAWISKFPRRLAIGMADGSKAGVALAGVLGVAFGAIFTPKLIVPQLALAWLLFSCAVLWYERTVEQPTDSEDLENPDPATAVPPAATVGATASVGATLASLGLVRWARSLIVFAVVCYGGPRVLLLAVASLAAAPAAVLVPGWMCSSLSCLAVAVLRDPSFISWFWADAATRADLVLVPKAWASTTDSVLATADAFAALSILAVYTSDVAAPSDFLAAFAGVLLACSSLGHVVVRRL
jgi:hypothetical protein